MGVPGWRVVDRPPSQHEHDDAKVAAVFVLEHGEAYGLDVTRGPTSEFILRTTYSPVGREMGDLSVASVILE